MASIGASQPVVTAVAAAIDVGRLRAKQAPTVAARVPAVRAIIPKTDRAAAQPTSIKTSPAAAIFTYRLRQTGRGRRLAKWEYKHSGYTTYMKQSVVTFALLIFLFGGATSCTAPEESGPTPPQSGSLVSPAASETASSGPSGPTEVPRSSAHAEFGLWLIDVASGELTSIAVGDRYPITRGLSEDGELVWGVERRGHGLILWPGPDGV